MAISSKIMTNRYVYMTLEYPDGHVIHGKCLTTSVEIEHPYGLYNSFDGETVPISITPSIATVQLVSDKLFFSESSEYVRRVERERASSEWKCWYCGRPNKAEREICASCNAVRQFVYR